MVRDWYKTGAPNDNYGLELISQEDAWTGYKRFLSSDYAAIADGGCPVIYFTYFSTKGLESCYTYHQENLGRSCTVYVNHLTGDLTHVYNDFTIYNRVPLIVNHVRSGIDLWDDIGFGHGIRLNISQTCLDLSRNLGNHIDQDIYKNDNRYRYKYTDEDGTEIFFYKDEDGTYKDELGKGLKIIIDESTDCIVIKNKNGFEYKFWGNSGKLFKMNDSSGNQVQVLWEGDYPKQVTNYQGLDINLTYKNGVLDTMTDQAGRITKYEYIDDGRYLNRIIRPDGTYTSFGYSYGRVTGIFDSETCSVINIEQKNEKVYGLRRCSSAHLDQWGNVIGDVLGKGVTFEYRAYSTIVRSCGANDILGDQDDILTEYQFDTFGRTTTVHTCRVDGSEDYGTQKYSYTANSTTNSQNNNKLTQIHSGGGYACDLLENCSFEYDHKGWGQETWCDNAIHNESSYVTKDSYFGNKCLKKLFLMKITKKYFTANILII